MGLHASKSLAFVAMLSSISALSLTSSAPVAQADVLDDIRGTVTADRLKRGPACPPLKYNTLLQDIAFAQGQLIPAVNSEGLIASYPGEVRSFIGKGDPMAAARTDAYNKGAGTLISNCEWTEYGVSFIRNDELETDWVGIVFGKPSVTTPPSGPGAPAGGQEPAGAPTSAQTTKCPPGGPKAEVPAGEKCPPPTNAIRVNIQRSSSVLIPFWPVTVTNSAGIGGSCSYVARDTRGGFGHRENFDIGPNGTANFTVPAPVVSRTYEVVTSCTGTYDGQEVEFGHDVQTVEF